MPFIAFLGCDGSGKSAVIAGVAAHLRDTGESVELGHWRPKPFSQKNTESPAAADDPHGQPPRGALGSAPDILLSRKQEVSREALLASRAKYESAGSSIPHFTKVDASAALTSVIAQVLKEIA